jgi:hypothetical protein
MIYRENEYALRWDIGRSDVIDQRDYQDVEWGKSRLPIGKMLLKAQGRITNATMQLDLWNAEARGTITTEKGSITWRSFVSINPDVIITELTETGTEKAQWEFIPEGFSVSRRQGLPGHSRLIAPDNCVPTQSSRPVEVINGIETAQQSLEVGGGYTTAWKVADAGKSRTKTLYLTVGYSYPKSTHTAQAVERITASKPSGCEAIRIGASQVVAFLLSTIISVHTRHTFGKLLLDTTIQACFCYPKEQACFGFDGALVS